MRLKLKTSFEPAGIDGGLADAVVAMASSETKKRATIQMKPWFFREVNRCMMCPPWQCAALLYAIENRRPGAAERQADAQGYGDMRTSSFQRCVPGAAVWLSSDVSRPGTGGLPRMAVEVRLARGVIQDSSTDR